MPEWTERVMWWGWKLVFPTWNVGCFGIKQTKTEPSKYILWYFELLIIILWYAKNLKCICFIWINLKIRHDCSCLHPQMEGEVSFRIMNTDSHFFYEPRGPRPELWVGLALKALRVCVSFHGNWWSFKKVGIVYGLLEFLRFQWLEGECRSGLRVYS